MPFDNHYFHLNQVPTIGNIMASRWAYEALTVTQFKDNKYEKKSFQVCSKMSFYSGKKISGKVI